jgi:hypothetical protein
MAIVLLIWSRETGAAGGSPLSDGLWMSIARMRPRQPLLDAADTDGAKSREAPGDRTL